MNTKEPKRYTVHPRYRTSACRSCNSSIVWFETETGSRVRLSEASAETGPDGTLTMFSHFVDCPSRDQHRRK